MLLNRKFGDYVLLRRLAVGGQSEVFLAYKVGPEDFIRPVVIKALPSKFRDDEKYINLFFKEAFISSRFAHPNVVTVHDAKRIEGEYCLVMDFIAGQTVSDIAQRGFTGGRPLSINQSVQIIADACNGLHYAHNFRDLDDSSYSIVHCDISPQNIMVTYNGVTKVFDFGIAHIPGYEDANNSMTVGGKFAYMSPEQLRGEDIDARSDIFSLGIILYELCTGFRLFRRKTQPEVIRAICEEPIRRPTEVRPDLPLFLERCILKALERDPDQRYPTAAAMRDDLHQLLAMMSKGDERDELGQYVASLFTQERLSISDTLRQSSQEDLKAIAQPMAGTTLGDLDAPQHLEEQTMDLSAPMELRNEATNEDPSRDPLGEHSRRRVDEAERDRNEARAEAHELAQNIQRLQQRQTLFIIITVLLVIVTAALVVLLVQGKGIPSA